MRFAFSLAFAATLFAGAPVEVRVGFPPSIFRGSDGCLHLGYELHVTNFYKSTPTLQLERMEVRAGSESLAVFEGDELKGRVLQPGSDDPRAIPGGMRAVVHVWITLKDPVPKSLTHRLTFGDGQIVDGVRTDVGRDAPLRLGSPFAGGIWLAHEGPGNQRAHHWGSLLAANGKVTVPQRFAIDFIGVDAQGSAVRGDFRGSKNEDWTGFGVDVLAAADGRVSSVHDGLPDNAPLSTPPPVSETLESIYGNYVVIDAGSGRFLHYAHLQKSSVRVKAGERVRRGQAIGRVGNSGNTNGPHLHFHVSDRESFAESESLPFVLEEFEGMGESTALRAIGAEAGRVAPAATGKIRLAMPLHGSVVRFR